MNKNSKLNIYIFIITICFIISIFILNIFSNKVLPIFMDYISSKIKISTTAMINKVVNDELLNIKEFSDLIIITKGNDDEIQMIDFNSAAVNNILTKVTTKLLYEFKNVQNHVFLDEKSQKYSNGFIFEVPLGVLSENVFFSNFGPFIPVKFNIVKDILTNINTEIKEYGINNALVEISIKVSVNQKIIIPFISKTENITVMIPVSLKLIQGNIPIYYGNGFTTNSNILSTPSS